MATPESLILSSLCEYLKRRKHFFWRNNTGAMKTPSGGFVRFGTPGAPDICVVHDGFFIGIEAKAPNGRQSPDQKEFERAVKEAGGEYYIARSIDDLIEIGL